MTPATIAARPRTSAMTVWRCTSGQGTRPGRALAVLDLDTESVRVGGKPLPQQMRIQAEFGQLVVAPGSADVRPRAQPAAHTPFGFLSEHQIAVPVYRSDGIDGASDNLSVIQMQRRAALLRQLAHPSRSVQPRGADFAAYRHPINAASEGSPQDLRQFCDRGQDAHRITMDEHQARIRIDLPDVIESKHVVRRLQDPPSCRQLGVEMLEKAAVESVGSEKAAALQPAVVR